MTRDDILDAAAQVIRKKGFHAASMADIAKAVNLQKASLIIMSPASRRFCLSCSTVRWKCSRLVLFPS